VTAPELVVVDGDITTLAVDVVVNAANRRLSGGGGVDGAIHAAGGPAIMAECRTIIGERGECPTGAAVITTAGDLPAQHVVHTVAPIWDGEHVAEQMLELEACYRNALALAAGVGASSVAFPNLGTGVYRVPKDLAAEVAITTTRDWIKHHHNTFERIVFVCHDAANLALYRAALD
jgi:O-acetyl-ADP-ribose deacetylase (regulator of RNase III)